ASARAGRARVRGLPRRQARGGRVAGADRGAALRRLRAPGDVADHGVADGDADLGQLPLQGARGRAPAEPPGAAVAVSAPEVVMLSGGTGGAKLARGLAAAVGPERLAVIANTGDDIEIYGAHVSPDPDLISFWLAGTIDERGWGLAGDTFAVMDGLRALGAE